MLIRPAARGDFDAIRLVELAAVETLRIAGAMSGSPAATNAEDLQDYLDQDLIYVACAEDGSVVGYCGGSVADRFLHIGEVDVHPSWQRKGLGRRLLTTLIDRGRARKLDAATLTTDRFAPFNAPFYTRLGFLPIEAEAAPRWLRETLEEEIARGLDPLRRVAMVLRFR